MPWNPCNRVINFSHRYNVILQISNRLKAIYSYSYMTDTARSFDSWPQPRLCTTNLGLTVHYILLFLYIYIHVYTVRGKRAVPRYNTRAVGSHLRFAAAIGRGSEAAAAGAEERTLKAAAWTTAISCSALRMLHVCKCARTGRDRLSAAAAPREP